MYGPPSGCTDGGGCEDESREGFEARLCTLTAGAHGSIEAYVAKNAGVHGLTNRLSHQDMFIAFPLLFEQNATHIYVFIKVFRGRAISMHICKAHILRAWLWRTFRAWTH